ncbi:hypothetical protein HHI36_002841, partial [Cryptolaemus montrouzieri]
MGVNIDRLHDLIMLLYAEDLVFLADSEVMCFSRNGQGCKFNFVYAGVELEVVDRYVYSRVPFVSSSLFPEMAESSLVKAKQAI